MHLFAYSLPLGITTSLRTDL